MKLVVEMRFAELPQNHQFVKAAIALTLIRSRKNLKLRLVSLEVTAKYFTCAICQMPILKVIDLIFRID
jgi:hypothetical protein